MYNYKTKAMAALLAVSMTVGVAPINAIAASRNTVNKTVTIKEDSLIEGIKLKVDPRDEVESDSSIIISIDNAEFNEDEIYERTGKSIKELLAYTAEENTLPYTIGAVSSDEIEVVLSGITTAEASKEDSNYFLIPLVAVAKNEGVVKISINSNETSISENDFTIAKITENNGATTLKVDSEKTFSDTLKVDTLTIKEDVYGTFEEGTIKVRVNGGFKLVNVDNIKVYNGVGLPTLDEKIKVKEDTEASFTFDIPKEWTNTTKASSIKIDGIEVEPEDEDKNWGEVKLTISGSSANVTKDTIVVGKRVDYGFSFEVIDEVPTILSGRTYYNNRNLDEDDFKTATVEFKETSVDSWITSRKLEFTVPEGVKIVDVDFDKIKEIKNLEDKTVIANKGQTLRIEKGIEFKNTTRDNDKEASFEFNLFLSIDADYSGDVTLSVAGAGLPAETLNDVKIAKAEAPINITTAETTANMGYQKFNTADITIEENIAGALLEDGEVIIGFDDKKFGNSELGFNDDDIEYAINGEIVINDFEVSSGEISFSIDKESYTASSITISNITVGTTRSVPYGSFDIAIFGDAVINNYKKNIDDIYPLTIDKVNEKDNEDIYFTDKTSKYSYEDYLKIITETGTLDNVVEVTIGNSEIKINDEYYDIDVAPYIQTSSNSTLVPLRFVSLALWGSVENADENASISWDDESKTATIFFNSKIIQFTADSNIMVVDGTKIPMENGVKAEINNGRMMVSFRALAQAFNIPVSWNAETRTARYN